MDNQLTFSVGRSPAPTTSKCRAGTECSLFLPLTSGMSMLCVPCACTL